jgi:hypothetical protein
MLLPRKPSSYRTPLPTRTTLQSSSKRAASSRRGSYPPDRRRPGSQGPSLSPPSAVLSTLPAHRSLLRQSALLGSPSAITQGQGNGSFPRFSRSFADPGPIPSGGGQLSSHTAPFRPVDQASPRSSASARPLPQSPCSPTLAPFRFFYGMSSSFGLPENTVNASQRYLNALSSTFTERDLYLSSRSLQRLDASQPLLRE